MAPHEALQQKMELIRSDYLKLSIQMQNIQMFADMNNLEVNWEDGIVTKK